MQKNKKIKNIYKYRKPDVILGVFLTSIRKIFDPEIKQLLFRLYISLIEPFPESEKIKTSRPGLNKHKKLGPYKSALIAALLFLLRGAAIEEHRNRAPVAISIAAPLLRHPAVENGYCGAAIEECRKIRL